MSDADDFRPSGPTSSAVPFGSASNAIRARHDLFICPPAIQLRRARRHQRARFGGIDPRSPGMKYLLPAAIIARSWSEVSASIWNCSSGTSLTIDKGLQRFRLPLLRR